MAGTARRADAAPAPDGRLRLEAWFPGSTPRPLEPLAGRRAGRARRRSPTPTGSPPGASGPVPFSVGRTLHRRSPRAGGGASPRSPDGRHLLRLPARAAFGTGSHESTSLALELLEDADVRGRRVLDVGTGTGVLAFAALLFGGARAVVGYDVDPAAPFHARDNSAPERPPPAPLRRHAGGPPRPARLRPRPGQRRAGADPPRDARPWSAGWPPGGEAILSGILAERGRQVLDRDAAGLGFAERGAADGRRLGRLPGRAERRGLTMITLLADPALFDARELRVEGDVLPAPLPGAAGGGGRASCGSSTAAGGRAGGRWRGSTARSATVTLGEPAPAHEPALRLELLVPTCRPERASWLVEKATEVGVSGIRFLNMARAPRDLRRRHPRPPAPGGRRGRRAVPPLASAPRSPAPTPGAEIARARRRGGRAAAGSSTPRRPIREAGSGGRRRDPPRSSSVPRAGSTPASGGSSSPAGGGRWASESAMLRLETAAVVGAAFLLLAPGRGIATPAARN